jgi:hypothetical protein
VSTIRLRWSSVGVIAGLLMFVPTGCAVNGGGAAYDGGYGYGADYYDTFGVDYGGWGDGYYVGPYRDHGYRGSGFGHSGPHAYRPASGSRGVPSIPSGGRGGGGHAGGGRGGGHH